jgi:hypothetical protein
LCIQENKPKPQNEYIWEGDEEVCHSLQVSDKFYVVSRLQPRWPTARHTVCF